MSHGVWRSLVARFVRAEEGAGSNPVPPTSKAKRARTKVLALFAPSEDGVVGSVATEYPDPLE